MSAQYLVVGGVFLHYILWFLVNVLVVCPTKKHVKGNDDDAQNNPG